MLRPLQVLLVVLLATASSVLLADEGPDGWSFKSAQAKDALKKYQAARDKLDRSFEKSRADNRDALVEKLKAQVTAATKAGNLDEALAIRSAIKLLQTDTADDKNSASAARQPEETSQPANKESSEPRPVLLVSMNFPTRMLGDDMSLTTDQVKSVFFIRPGLSGAGTVSLESMRYPGSFIIVPKGLDPRRLNFLTLEKIGGDANQKRRASFKMRPGVAHKGLASFESATVPGYFIRHRNFKFEVAQLPPLAEDLQCATYKITDVSE